jgi:predicted outer membrane repeat protein
MTNTLTARAGKAANTIQSVVYAQDCHVRIGDDPTTYTSVQAAVDAAYTGELVKVAGTCMGVYGAEFARQQVYLDKSLTIQGGYSTGNWTAPDHTANPTTLDARGQGRVFYLLNKSDENTTTIDGFNITGGNAWGQIGDHTPDGRYGSGGGGMYMYGGYEAYTLSNDNFYNNIAGGGGGLMTSFSSAVNITGVTFTGNRASGGGGYYLHAGSANLTDVVFDSNTASGNGGGIDVVAGNANILRGTFVNNHAGEAGGAMNTEMGWSINESLILSNTAKYGGGISVADFINWSMVTSLTNTVIADNQATLEGAGVFILRPDAAYDSRHPGTQQRRGWQRHHAGLVRLDEPGRLNPGDDGHHPGLPGCGPARAGCQRGEGERCAVACECR